MSFSHLDPEGNPRMVDVGQKPPTRRLARARAVVVLDEAILEQLESGEINTPKGPVFRTAILAGILAAKKTGELIPLCHPLGMDHCEVEVHLNAAREVVIDCTATITARTGVEMEALTGATIAALTVYDMCKAFSHDIRIREVMLMEKTGGKRDFKREE